MLGRAFYLMVGEVAADPVLLQESFWKKMAPECAHD
jgi:hypothetical protein